MSSSSENTANIVTQRTKDDEHASGAGDSSSKERIRKNKKPEIQLYQPRALREKRQSQPSDQAKSPQESVSPKVQVAKENKKEETQSMDVKQPNQEASLHRIAAKFEHDTTEKLENKELGRKVDRKKKEMVTNKSRSSGDTQKGNTKASEAADVERSSNYSKDEKLKTLPSTKDTFDIRGSSRNSNEGYKRHGQCDVEDENDSRNTEKRGRIIRGKYNEKPQKKRTRNPSNKESDEVQSAEFYSSSYRPKGVDYYQKSLKFKNEERASKSSEKQDIRVLELSKSDNNKNLNNRTNRKYDEAREKPVDFEDTTRKDEPLWAKGKSNKGKSPPKKGRPPQSSKGDLQNQDIDNSSKNEENKIREKSVVELAAKIDELSIENAAKLGSTRANEVKSHGLISVQKGKLREHHPKDSYSEVSDRNITSSKQTGGFQKQIEKTNKAKSYAEARESRKNRSGYKALPPSDKQNIEVTVNRDGQGRITHMKKGDDLPKKDFHNPKAMGRHRKHSEGSGSEKDVAFSTSFKYPQRSFSKPTVQERNAKVLDSCDDDDVYMEDEDETVEPLNFVEVPEWDTETDRNASWGAERERSNLSRASIWDDEKPPWTQKREKKRSESQDTYSRRADSPGHKGGLIQLPASLSTSENTFHGSSNTEHVEPLMQKHLYNPNNPSKPVPVIPSARDMPISRDSQREGSRGFEDSGAGTITIQSHQSSSHVPEYHNTKIDPTLLYNIQKGEMDISYYVSSNQLPMEFRRIMDIRNHLQACYKQLLMCDIRMCQEKNIEGALWKTLYYTIIEKLREYINREPTLKDRSLATLRMLVDEGQQYLQSLLDALQKEYNFTLEDHLEEEGISNSGTRTRGIRMPLMSAQKLLLSLGDLARYKEHYSPSPNYALAKKWYQMALQVYPRNGRPFNQLAIIAANQKRPLDVVYYYIRSLMASNPFVSARDSLVSMFDDIRKKYISSQGNAHHAEGVCAHEGRASGGESLRQEIWIRPDSGATHRRTLSQSTDDDEKDKQDDLKKLPLDQLMKRFLTSYLHCHGMLFSRVGLDEFPKCCQNMLREFTVLLHTTPPRLSTNHLLQIMAINMYAVKHTEAKETRVGSGYRAAAQELSLVLAHEMFGRLTQVVVELLPHNLHFQTTLQNTAQHHQTQQQQLPMQQPPDAADPQRLFTPTLAHFMPPLKAWCDWLLYQFTVWNPPPDAHEYANKDTSGGTWCSVAELATIMRGLGPPDIELSFTDTGRTLPPNAVFVRLTEDAFLRGYEPLLQAHKQLVCVPSGEHMGRACDWARVMQIQKCLCQLLCGVDPPVLRLQKTDQGDVLISVVDTTPPDTPTPRLSESSLEDMEDSMSESDTSELEEEMQDESGEGDEDTPLASTVRLLTQRKKLLEKKQRQQRKLQSKLEGSVTLEMEVRPRYLVPDTNCFIEHLEEIQALAKSAPYTLMVPLVVLNELDGLSRDAAVAKYGSVGHAVKVREGAAAALYYLREEKPHSVKCVTSQGSVLSSTSFTAEIDMSDSTNDDKILSCCVHFCSDSTQRRPIKAGVRRLYREVVLLTEDRNLRVKAHARDVPVRNLLDFARWAGIR